MSDWPRYVLYKERLVPDSKPIEVEIPQSRDDEFDLLATLDRLAGTDPVQWKALYRQMTACDWYFLALCLSGSQRLDPFTGKPELDCDFHFNYAREHQFEGDGVVDKSSRGHWKSTWGIYVGVTNDVIIDPEISIGLFAFEKGAAMKHGRRVKDEWTNNIELKTAWDDVFFMDPEHESPLWNQDTGLIVKRSIAGSSPTFSWYSIEQLPTGLRISKGIFDDIETEATVNSEEARHKLKERVKSAFNLAGRACRWRIYGTHHHPAGWIADLETSGAWKIRCHAAEDITKPAPDIAAIFDANKGMLPVREEAGQPIKLVPEIRQVRLEGEPVFWHPLECAQQRFLDGPEVYAAQCMGDPLAGQQKRLDPDWIKWYEPDPVDWARGSNLIICIDASKGVGDAMFARVEALKADKTISWVGGLRRKVPPSEFGPAIFQLAMEWIKIGRLVAIRVEEFGQSTWSHLLRTYFDSRNHHVCPIIACGRHSQSNKESTARHREWAGLEPMYRMGKRLYPKTGIRVFDELGHSYDLVDYYIRKEFSLFPLPITDDGLAADFLLAVDKGKNEAGDNIDLFLEFPDSDEDYEINDRSQRSRSYGDESSWMSEMWG